MFSGCGELVSEVSLQLRHGEKVAFAMTDEPDWEAFLNQDVVYEPEVSNALLRFVKPGDFCIDAGANLGYFSLMMSRLAGDDGEVLAFEPDPKFLIKLQNNITLNEIENIQTFDVPLWSADELIAFHLHEWGGYSSVLKYEYGVQSSRSMVARSLDSFIKDEEPGLPKFRVLKIDCEGAEEKILHGATKLLVRGIDCVIIEMNFFLMPYINSSEKSIRSYMRSLGYDMFLLDPYGTVPRRVPDDVELVSGDDPHDFSGGPPPIFNVLFSTEHKVATAWS